jgi:tetratricopeptide (TPR) repeat protein
VPTTPKGILERSIKEVDRRDDLPREQVAWFHYRLGELHLRRGNLAAADSAFARGLARNPHDVRVLGGLARTALARGDWQRAITLGEEATSIQPDPATLGAVSQAATALGDSATATQFAKAMAVSALRQPGPIHRQWGLFLLDHGTDSERRQVLNRARREIKERQDVYGHDLAGVGALSLGAA